MQTYMVKRDCAYRGVAEKIFFKLMSKFSTDDRMHEFLKSHAGDALGELATVDELLKLLGGRDAQADLLTPRIPQE